MNLKLKLKLDRLGRQMEKVDLPDLGMRSEKWQMRLRSSVMKLQRRCKSKRQSTSESELEIVQSTGIPC